MRDPDNLARVLLVIGFILVPITSSMLFYTSHWTGICIVDSIEKPKIDLTELQKCVLNPSDIDDILLILNTLGFIALTYSSAIAIRKRKTKTNDTKSSQIDSSLNEIDDRKDLGLEKPDDSTNILDYDRDQKSVDLDKNQLQESLQNTKTLLEIAEIKLQISELKNKMINKELNKPISKPTSKKTSSKKTKPKSKGNIHDSARKKKSL